MRCLIRLSCFILSLRRTESFIGTLRERTSKVTTVRVWQTNKDDPDNQDNIEKENRSLVERSVTHTDDPTFEEKMDKFLDTEFFNP